MRTKTLLMALAALSAGVLYSNAQPVYSANIVGYANNVIPNGYTMLVSPLQASSTNNAEQVLTCLQVGDQLLFWNGSGYSIKLYGGPGQWFDGVTFNPINAPSLPMGTAFFYQNNQSVAETNTSVGTVVLTNSIGIAS